MAGFANRAHVCPDMLSDSLPISSGLVGRRLNPRHANRDEVRRLPRQTSIASLLLCALLYAWLGHDLQQHHHHHHDGPQHVQHDTQGEASHTKAVHRGQDDATPQLLVVALLTGFCDFALSQPVALEEVPALDFALLIEPQFWERPASPRAPPTNFSFS